MEEERSLENDFPPGGDENWRRINSKSLLSLIDITANRGLCIGDIPGGARVGIFGESLYYCYPISSLFIQPPEGLFKDILGDLLSIFQKGSYFITLVIPF